MPNQRYDLLRRRLPLLVIAAAWAAVSSAQPISDPNRPRLPRPRALHGHQVEPFFSMPAYVDRLVADIDVATKSVLVDQYFLGGSPGRKIVLAMDRARQRGLEVRLLMDKNLGTIGRLKGEVKQTVELLRELGMPWRIAPTREGTGVRRRVADHNKISVVDDAICYVGGTNVSDVWANYNDLMMRVEGPVAADLASQVRFDWYLTSHYEHRDRLVDQTFEGDGLLESGSEPGRSTIRLFGTGLGRRTFEGALMNCLRSAKKSIDVQVHQLNHEAAIDELIAAHRRGVAVRVFLDPTNVDNLIPVIKKGPRHVFNAYAMTKLDKAGVPVQFVKVEDALESFHMKFGLFDGQVLLVGTANWDRRAAEVLTESELEIAGGPAVAKVQAWFEKNWATNGHKPRVGFIARISNWLMNRFL